MYLESVVGGDVLLKDKHLFDELLHGFDPGLETVESLILVGELDPDKLRLLN